MKQKGFTLIELLVVISIIAMLSTIILASLNSARSKGSDAAVKEGMHNLQEQAALYYSSSSNYASLGITSYGPNGWNQDTTLTSGIPSGTNYNLCNGKLGYGNPSWYTVFNDSQVESIVNSIISNSTGFSDINCSAGPSTFNFVAGLKGAGGYWCVDSTGYVGATTSNAILNDGLCQ